MILHVPAPDPGLPLATPTSSVPEFFPALPPGFVLGTATSAYQVEGAVDVEGRSPSIWDTFARRPGRIADGTTGEVAADHYHRLDEDLRLLGRLGAGGYRFSFAWPRIQPSGRGPANRCALDFYDRLVDGLLEADVAPMATLYHWDLPQTLEDAGGWLERSTIDRFADYAALLGERYADRVSHWVPVNEPAVMMVMGHMTGMHAPGYELMFDALPIAHHLLLAHGRAVAELRGAGARSIGCANNHAPMWPASDGPADVGATKLFDAVWNGLFLEPMLLGRYPEDLAPLMEEVVHPGDLALLRQPLDFYGLTYHAPMKVGAAPAESPTPFELRPLVGHPVTDSGRPIVPEGLREWLITARARFRAALPPLVVTENGGAFADVVGTDGAIDDADRIAYLDAHLRAVVDAVASGVDVRGYYAWSLLDTFEWNEGLQRRFGLVRVDPLTQERTPKRSFDWYAALVRAQTASPG